VAVTSVVTKATGGTAKPVGLLYIEPDLQMRDAGSGTTLSESGLDAAFVADLLSACVAHERCGLHLYRSIAARTTMDELRSQYEHFGEETARHVEILEELISASGGNPSYVSPSARATEKADAGLVEATWALTGSVDVATAELAMLEAVVLAETKDLANWQLLDMLANQMADGPVRQQLTEAVAEVLDQESEHYGWAAGARTRMLFGLATGGAEPPAEDEIVDLTDMTRDELYATAQELNIEGRSEMSRDELAKAVGEATEEVR
jgi:rubrerythrin